MTEAPQASVNTSMEQIRSFLSRRGFAQHSLLPFDFASACAAADVLEDAQLAIDAFSRSDKDENVGRDYLEIYGVLQAAYLQQNALLRLFGACGLGNTSLPPSMEPVRDLRNAAIAHPAPKPNEGRQTATFVARYSVGTGMLALMQVRADGHTEHSTAPLRRMLDEHEDGVLQALSSVSAHLTRLEELARSGIRERGPVQSLLHPTWSYMLSKIHEAACGSRSSGIPVARASAEALLDMLRGVIEGLASRGLPPIEEWHISRAEAGLNRICGLLEGSGLGDDVPFDSDALDTFAEWVGSHVRHIETVLREIDQRLEKAA